MKPLSERERSQFTDKVCVCDLQSHRFQGLQGWGFCIRKCHSDLGLRCWYTLTSIGDYAFQYCSSLMSIALPAGLTSFGPGAFYGCSSMASIDLPAGGRVR